LSLISSQTILFWTKVQDFGLAHSVEDDEDRKLVLEALKRVTVNKPFFNDVKMDKAVACMLGNVIGDAFGAPTEFSDVRYGTKKILRTGNHTCLFYFHEGPKS
jgi:hypothetical protein